MRLKEKKRSDSSKSSASHLADVVSGIVTAHVVPLVIPRLKQFDRFNHHHHDDYVVTTYNGEERVVLFPECEAHLVVLVVVRLTIPPVKPEHYCHQPQPCGDGEAMTKMVWIT